MIVAFFALQGAFAGGGMYAQNPTYLAASLHLGFAIPMLIGSTAGAVSFIAALLLSPETRGKRYPTG
jgi:hypothetical protein